MAYLRPIPATEIASSYGDPDWPLREKASDASIVVLVARWRSAFFGRFFLLLERAVQYLLQLYAKLRIGRITVCFKTQNRLPLAIDEELCEVPVYLTAAYSFPGICQEADQRDAVLASQRSSRVDREIDMFGVLVVMLNSGVVSQFLCAKVRGRNPYKNKPLVRVGFLQIFERRDLDFIDRLAGQVYD